MLHKAILNPRLRILIAVLACFLYSLSVNWFIVPMGLYSGGLLGTAQLLRTLLSRVVSLPAGVDLAGFLYLMLNVPILLLAWRSLGRGFFLRTLLCTGCCSLFLSLIPSPSAPLVEETLTSCVIGGILCGFSIGLTLTCGCSTGGLDIVGLWLAKRGSSFTVGRFSMSYNAMLYVLCAILFDLRTMIYSIIYTVFSSLFVDRVHQQNISAMVMIFTREEGPELLRAILGQLGRGVTYWEGHGAYTGHELRVLCVCISKFEEGELRAIVQAQDPQAFFIVQEGVHISGHFLKKLG